MNSILFKVFVLQATVVLYQFYNGFSGAFPIPNLLAAMFSINMTLFLQAFYVVIHKDIDFAEFGASIEAEQKLPFKMAQFYTSRKNHVGRFLSDYLIGIAWGILCGVFMYYQYSMFQQTGGIGFANGQILSADAFGVYIIVVGSLIADIWIMRYIRCWDWLQVLVFIFSVFWIPFNLWREESLRGSSVTGAIFGLMLASPVYLLNIALTVGVAMLPFLFTRRVRTVILEPHLYSKI